MRCTICGSDWHEAKNCPKGNDAEAKPDEPISQIREEETELPEYAEAARCYRLAGGG
jgi:hypothetical protein